MNEKHVKYLYLTRWQLHVAERSEGILGETTAHNFFWHIAKLHIPVITRVCHIFLLKEVIRSIVDIELLITAALTSF